MLAKIFLWSWRGELVHGTSDRAKSNVLTLEFRLFLRTHLSYRKISRTHSTPVRSTKLLFVLTSDFCVRLSTHFRCSSFSTVLTSMQGSHSSIFDVLCTHFRFTNKQSYSLPEGNQNVLTSECDCPALINFKHGIFRPCPQSMAGTASLAAAPGGAAAAAAAPSAGSVPPPLGAPLPGGAPDGASPGPSSGRKTEPAHTGGKRAPHAMQVRRT